MATRTVTLSACLDASEPGSDACAGDSGGLLRGPAVALNGIRALIHVRWQMAKGATYASTSVQIATCKCLTNFKSTNK